MSSYEFNAFTGSFSPVPKLIVGYNEVVVDAAFLLTPEITFATPPVENSEDVKLNGLGINNSNYTIVGNILTMSVTQLEIGDSIYVNHIGCS